MAVMIRVYSGERCVGQCDARCYNAQRGNCSCICGGVNHGAGFAQALKNTEDMVERDEPDLGFEKQLRRFRADRGWPPDLVLRIAVPAVQLELL
jgi:hypothetical protein